MRLKLMRLLKVEDRKKYASSGGAKIHFSGAEGMDQQIPLTFRGTVVVPKHCRLARMAPTAFLLHSAASAICQSLKVPWIIISYITVCCQTTRFGAIDVTNSKLACTVSSAIMSASQCTGSSLRQSCQGSRRCYQAKGLSPMSATNV